MPDRPWRTCSLTVRHQQRSTSMTKHPPIASEHARAICDEIGERLRFALRDDYTDLPPRLRALVSRLAELDCDAPSLVPTLDEMTLQAA